MRLSHDYVRTPYMPPMPIDPRASTRQEQPPGRQVRDTSNSQGVQRILLWLQSRH